jgi:putative membrane protein
MFPAVTSAFKEKYPLSPKKFWKKMLGSIIGNGVVSVVFGGFCGMIAMIYPVLLKSNADPILINFPIFFLLGFLVAAAILFGLSAWYINVYIRTYFYDAGEGFLTIRKGVFTPSEIHVMYQKIQDVYVDQDIFDRIIGLYDVHIASATVTSGIEAHIDGVDAATADALKNFLLSSINSGGIGGVTAPRPAVAEVVDAAQPHIVVPTNISSETYPMSPRWTISMVINSILFSAILVAFFGTQFAVGINSSVGDDLVAIILIFCFIVLLSFQIIASLLWKANFSWVFAPNFLEVRTGIISKSETHMPYSSIQDVLIKQGLIERLFGLCTVTIQNAVAVSSRKAGQNGTRLPGQPLAKGNELAEIVRKMSQNGLAGRL